VYSLPFSALRPWGLLKVAAVIGLMSHGAAGARAANVLLNPGFETDAMLGQEPLPGATDWTAQGTGSQNTTSAPMDPVRTGVGSLQIVGGGGFGVPLMVRTFPASPGQRWDLQGYMLTKEALPANATFAILKIVFDDGVMDLEPGMIFAGEADAPAFPGIVALPRLNNTSAVNTWQFTHAAGIAPAGTFQVRLFALLVDESPATVYFDDLQAILAGDFDSDLDIDADDLTVWKGAFGQTAAGDADGDGDSDGGDFLLWQRYLGPVPPVAAAAGAVPEPGTAVLLAAGLALCVGAAGLRKGAA